MSETNIDGIFVEVATAKVLAICPRCKHKVDISGNVYIGLNNKIYHEKVATCIEYIREDSKIIEKAGEKHGNL